MKLPRRIFLRLTAGAAALPPVSRIAMAQVYPSRPVRLIVGFPGGTTGDILMRLMGQWLSDRLGQPFIIENRPGAAGNVATDQVVRAAPDGYTLLLAVPANAINASLYDNLNFKANPGKINMASFGNGTLSHVSGELFMMRASVDMLHVPYRGSWMPDLLAGQVQVVFSAISIVIDNIRTGKLRALAVTSAMRSDALPDVPTLGEFVPGYEAVAWYGLCGPRNTPTEVANKLHETTNLALADPKLKARLADLVVEPMPMRPVQLGKFIADETEKWGKVIRAARIKAG